MLTTKENTRRNAYTGTTYPYLPSALVPKPDRKVKFAGSLRRKSGDETVPLADNREPTPTKDCFVHVQGIAITTDEEQPSKKEPIRPGVAPTGVPFGSASRIPTVRWDRGLIPRLEHKASTLTVGSESVYSTQSGEPHIERDSKGFFSALDPRRLSTWTRSSGSVYSQPDEPVPPPTLQPLPPVAVSQQQGRTPERHPKAAVDQRLETVPEHHPETAPECPPQTMPQSPPKAASTRVTKVAMELSPKTTPERPPNAASLHATKTSGRPLRTTSDRPRRTARPMG